MKKPITTIPDWNFPTPAQAFVDKHGPAEVERWRKLLSRVIDIAREHGWNKAEVGRRAGVKDGTFSQWSNGNYPGLLGNVNDDISNWLDALEESAGIAASLPVSPKFIRTATGAEVYNVLLYSQLSAGFTMVVLPSGSGKTTAARHFVDTRPHCWIATVSPHTKTVHGLLVELAMELDVQEHNPARLVRAIGRRLQRIGEGSLLIIDEAQNLVPDAINQLRHFVDNYNCGVALIGNEDTGTAFLKERGSIASRAQVVTRFDRRLRTERDPAGDARMLISAWGIEDADCVKFLSGIASKPGALRNIDRTVRAAAMMALGAGEDISLKHLTAAWRNRDMGELA
ncbi:AAA family ATPase [Mycoplana ramosa]|uniref:AAA family ATPase n=1 Tax=Mycoplana ramosa TaxID=40837 RepID=A0ABW3Z232_MYCRA